MADDTALLAIILPLSILGTLIALAVALPILLRRYCFKCWNDIMCYECCQGTAFCMDCCGGQDGLGCDCPCGPVVEDYPKPGHYPEGYMMGQPRQQLNKRPLAQPPGYSDQVPPFASSNPNIHTNQPSFMHNNQNAPTPIKNVEFSEFNSGDSNAPTSGSTRTAFQKRLSSETTTVPSEPYPTSILNRPTGPIPPNYEMPRSTGIGGPQANRGLHHGDSWSSAEIDLPNNRLLSNRSSTQTHRTGTGGISRVTSTSTTRGAAVPVLENSMSSTGTVPPTPPKTDYPISNYPATVTNYTSSALPPPISQAPGRPSWKPAVPSGWQYQPLTDPTYTGPAAEKGVSSSTQYTSSTTGLGAYSGAVNINQGIYVTSANNDGYTTSTTRVTTQQERKVVMLSGDY